MKESFIDHDNVRVGLIDPGETAIFRFAQVKILGKGLLWTGPAALSGIVVTQVIPGRRQGRQADEHI
jgi:hypothetical protein